MLSKTRSTPVYLPAPGVIPDAITAPASNGSPVVTDSDVTLAQPSAATDRETRRERSRRKAHRSRLHGYAILAVALGAFLIALAATNTAHVKVSWVFRQLSRLACLAGAIRRDPRLASRARRDRCVSLAHPRAAATRCPVMTPIHTTHATRHCREEASGGCNGPA